MTIDCPCGEMYDGPGSCPKCGRKASLAFTDEAHDHYPDDDCDLEDLEDESEGDYERM